MTNLEEKTLETRTVYQGRIVDLKLKRVELPDEQISMREIVEHTGGAAVVPYHKDEEKVVLIKQFRKAVEEIVYELPAGLIERDEEDLKCAQRELEEETGYQAANFQKLGQFYTSPGFTDEILHIYLATNLNKYEQQTDKDEHLEVVEMSLPEVKEKLAEGYFKDAKTVIGLQYLLQEIN